jgi:hypothetical protein
MKIAKEDEKLFKDVVFLVQATDTERYFLWCIHADPDSNNTRYPYQKLQWDQEGLGKIVTIGYLDKRPTCVEISYAKLNGKRVMFYEGCSELVDHDMIRKWLEHWTLETIRWDAGTRWAHCDAMNFGHCIEHVTKK